MTVERSGPAGSDGAYGREPVGERGRDGCIHGIAALLQRVHAYLCSQRVSTYHHRLLAYGPLGY